MKSFIQFLSVNEAAKIPPVKSLSHLRQLSQSDPRYKKLTVVASKNLGGMHGSHPDNDYESAHRNLHMNASETDEKGVVGEVNYCRDLINENVDSDVDKNLDESAEEIVTKYSASAERYKDNANEHLKNKRWDGYYGDLSWHHHYMQKHHDAMAWHEKRYGKGDAESKNKLKHHVFQSVSHAGDQAKVDKLRNQRDLFPEAFE